MIHFDFRHLQNISPSNGLSLEEISSMSGRLGEDLKRILSLDLGFYRTIDDEKLLDDVKAFAMKVKGKYDDIVVLGIGGSALGTLCLQQSLKGLFEDREAARSWPRLMVLDNIDPVLIREAEQVLHLERTLFLVVTKSGSTPETLSQYLYFRKKCDRAGLPSGEHFVFITDPSDGFLRKAANRGPGGLMENIPSFEIPPNVGGRFSVLTAVGLLPAALIGIDIENLLKGARRMRDLLLSQGVENNLPFQLAVVQYLLYRKGKVMNVLIPYSQKLIRFADWYRQLLAESIGKKVDRQGKEIFVGLTPVNALGVTDQHSQSQLYNEGPNDKLHLFLGVHDTGAEIEIPDVYADEPSLRYLKGVSFHRLLSTEMAGTMEALTQNDRPNGMIEIERVDAENLGELFMLFEGATAFLGEFFDINAFDQPGVELSKQITKKLLGGSK